MEQSFTITPILDNGVVVAWRLVHDEKARHFSANIEGQRLMRRFIERQLACEDTREESVA